MNQQNLSSLLRQTWELPEQTVFCPEVQLIALYFDSALSENRHGQVQKHISDCAYCQALLGVLARPPGDESCVQVDEELLVTAKQLAGGAVSPKIRQAPIWAAVALVVLTLSVTNFRGTGQTVDTAVPPQAGRPAEINTTQQRSIKFASSKPQLLSPIEGALVDPGELVIRWTEIPDGLFYDIRIVRLDGSLITRQRVWGTQWALPAETNLQMGQEYFVRVDVFVSEDKALSSEHVVFKVRGNLIE